jgi:glucosyl-3-phosphoglycerate synthase
VRPDVHHWLGRRTSRAADWTLPELLARKGATTVSVVLPARDEEATVGSIVATVRRELVDDAPLVDEVVVVDSGSSDRTAAVAAAAGARVVHRDAALPAVPPLPGKGEVLWRSLAVTRGDLVVFVDADLTDFSAHFVTGLLGPLLTDPAVAFVKAAYERPFGAAPDGGGRVTELVARPLLNLHWPQLAGFVQPLAGEYAARRTLLETLPFPTGYGVELGLLVDALGRVGLDALAQVDLGVRRHRHQDTAALGRMASEILQTALDRLERADRIVRRDESSPLLTQFRRRDQDGAGWAVDVHDVRVRERPPITTLTDPALSRAGAS